MKEGHLVSPAMVQGWGHRHSRRVSAMVMENVSVEELADNLDHVLWDHGDDSGMFGCWFIPLPFIAASPEAERVEQAWRIVKQRYPDSVVIRDFFWKFYRPQECTMDAILMQNAGHMPIPAGEAIQQALVA